MYWNETVTLLLDVFELFAGEKIFNVGAVVSTVKLNVPVEPVVFRASTQRTDHECAPWESEFVELFEYIVLFVTESAERLIRPSTVRLQVMAWLTVLTAVQLNVGLVLETLALLTGALTVTVTVACCVPANIINVAMKKSAMNEYFLKFKFKHNKLTASL